MKDFLMQLRKKSDLEAQIRLDEALGELLPEKDKESRAELLTAIDKLIEQKVTNAIVTLANNLH